MVGVPINCINHHKSSISISRFFMFFPSQIIQPLGYPHFREPPFGVLRYGSNSSESQLVWLVFLVIGDAGHWCMLRLTSTGKNKTEMNGGLNIPCDWNKHIDITQCYDYSNYKKKTTWTWLSHIIPIDVPYWHHTMLYSNSSNYEKKQEKNISKWHHPSIHLDSLPRTTWKQP